LPSEVLPTPGGPTSQLVSARLHREVLDDALLDLLQAVVVVVEDRLGVDQVLLDLRLLVPRDRQEPVEIVAHDGRFGRHRRHLAELLELVGRLVARFLRQAGLLDLLLQLGELVLAFLVAELLLDRLHLFVQVVLALRLLHLPLDAGADALLHLQHRDLALHQAEHLLEPLGDGRRLEDRLLVGDLDGEVRRDRIGELGIVLDLLDHADHLGRDLLVELHVALELGDDRARQRLGLDPLAGIVGQRFRLGLVVVSALAITDDARALGALDQHLDGAVGQLEQLQHARERADLEDRVGGRVVVGGVLLRREQDEGVVAHHLFERTDRLLAADEQRHDHVGKDDDVAQRQDRIGPPFTGLRQGARLGLCRHVWIPVLGCAPPRDPPAWRRRSGVQIPPGPGRGLRCVQFLGRAPRPVSSAIRVESSNCAHHRH
jgi:hypothetical protein